MRRQVLRPLVHRPGRVADRDAGHPEQHPGVAPERERVRQRIARVAGDRADAVFGDHRCEQLGAAPECGVPADLPPLAVHLDHRRPDAVGVFVDGAQRRALGAQVPPAPGVVAVAADAGDAAVGDLNLQAAHGFTQRTGVKVATVPAGGGQRLGVFGGHRLTVDRCGSTPPRFAETDGCE
jgi:hypothetical protein